MKEITAAGGVLYKGDNPNLQVLLIFRNGVWDLPKGKLEKNESIEECAIREVQEEVGCQTPENRGKLITTYHQYAVKNKRYGKNTHWYAMTTATKTDFSPEEKEGIDEVGWFPLKEAKQKVGFKNLINTLISFEEWHRKSSLK